jgi:hypothetical protein
VFFTAIVGSLAGAFAGAYGGQWIVAKGKAREELLKEIHNTNAAIMVAFGISNSLLLVKKQHVKSLKENFDVQKASFLAHKQKWESGQLGSGAVFNLHADLRTLPRLALPVGILQKQIFEKLSLGGKPLLLTTTLSAVIDALNSSIDRRNQLIESYKADSYSDGASLPPQHLPFLYFGLPDGGGQTNLDYPSLVEAIYHQTDDGIFFSCQLCNALAEHGEQIAGTFKKKFGKGAPLIHKPLFNKAEEADLMPNPDTYADWASMFVKRGD